MVNGGTISITAQSPFDYDTTGTYNGGTIIVNGTETVHAITNQMMGGMGGGMGGGMRPPQRDASGRNAPGRPRRPQRITETESEYRLPRLSAGGAFVLPDFVTFILLDVSGIWL